jgi:hypothetical protein
MTGCRLCGGLELASVIDLGATPPCERFLTASALDDPEVTYPLHLRVCTSCWLTQLPSLIDPAEIFSEYAYFSAYSDSHVAHARHFVTDATNRLSLGQNSFVVEVASNDGYLLQHVLAEGIRCLGIEPARNVAEVAVAAGIPTVMEFLGPDLARALRAAHGPADLVVANNVYAHMPDIVGFTEGLRALVADDGWVSIEVQYLLTMLEHTQYDTIYHEHFQYWTVGTAAQALANGGLTLVDVEHIPTHGGSIRLWARPTAAAGEPSAAVAAAIEAEKNAGLYELRGYAAFAERVTRIRMDLLEFLIDAARAGKLVVGYGAPGKGNTLLNHCGIRSDLLAYTVDRNPYKHGRFTPGTRIPILPPQAIATDQPDYVLVLPWNLRPELTDQLRYIGAWGGALVFPVPTLEIVEVPA